MTRSLKWHKYRFSWSLLPEKNSSFPPFPDGLNFAHYDGKKVFLNFATHWGHAFGFKIFVKVMNLMWHLSSIREPYKFEPVHWMAHKLPLYMENLKVLCPLRWNFWGISDLYLSVVREGGILIGLCKRWSCQLRIGSQKFFPSILSHRGTCTLHEYVRYWNIHPYVYTNLKSSHF